MPRAIGSGNSITVGTGQIPTTDAFTWLAVVRTTSLASQQTAVGLGHAVGNSSLRLSTGGVFQALINSTSVALTSATVTASSGWVFVAVSKDSGSGSYRYCLLVYETGTVTTGTQTSAQTGSGAAVTGAAIGSTSAGTGSWLGEIAAIGMFARPVSAAADLSRYAASLGMWLSLGSGAMWVPDQASASVPVLDWTGGGANQTAITGTSVATASSPIGYGHPIIAPTRSTAKHLFTTQTPSTTNAADGTPGITTATTLKFAQAGTVSGVRFFSTTTVSGVYAVALWSVDSSDPGTGTLLASKTMTSAPAAGTWNSVNFTTPVSVNTTTLYRAGVFSGDGRYVATTNFGPFVSGAGGLTNGDIWAPHNGDNPVGAISISQGTFEINASATYPNDPGNETSYFLDVDFQPTGGGPVTHNADATLAATGGLSGAATRDTSTTATLAGTGTLTGTAARSTGTTATLAGVGALTATAVRTQDTTATLAATGALTGTAAHTQATTATLAATGALAATGTTGADQTATLTGTGGLTATGDRTAVTTGALAATGALAGTAVATRFGTVTLAGLGALTAVGDVTTPGIETATLSGTGGLSATAARTAVDTSLVAGVGALTGTVARATSAMATLAGLGALSATAIVVRPGDATTAPTSALRTTTRPTVLATVSRPLVLRTGRPPT